MHKKVLSAQALNCFFVRHLEPPVQKRYLVFLDRVWQLLPQQVIVVFSCPLFFSLPAEDVVQADLKKKEEL